MLVVRVSRRQLYSVARLAPSRSPQAATRHFPQVLVGVLLAMFALHAARVVWDPMRAQIQISAATLTIECQTQHTIW